MQPRAQGFSLKIWEGKSPVDEVGGGGVVCVCVRGGGEQTCPPSPYIRNFAELYLRLIPYLFE